MAINADQLRRFQKDYFAVTGRTVDGFHCPITLQGRPQSELMMGHILNDAILDASRRRVVQWERIDHYFGRTIEPKLIDFVNAPLWSDEKFLTEKAELYAEGPRGKKWKLFHPTPKSVNDQLRARHPQVHMVDAGGNIFARPFIKASHKELPAGAPISFKAVVGFNEPAIIGSLLKSAYLALFELVGYRWVFSRNADVVRRRLARFYLERGTEQTAGSYFSGFRGCGTFIMNEAFDGVPDTPSGGALLLHYVWDALISRLPLLPSREVMFAMSCLFRINGTMFVVTLPAHAWEREWPTALSCYQQYLRDRWLPQRVYYTTFDRKREKWIMDPMPLPTQFDEQRSGKWELMMQARARD